MVSPQATAPVIRPAAPAARPASRQQAAVLAAKPAPAAKPAAAAPAGQVRPTAAKTAAPAAKHTAGQAVSPASGSFMKRAEGLRTSAKPVPAARTAPAAKSSVTGPGSFAAEFAAFAGPRAALDTAAINFAVAERHTLGVKDLRKRFGRKEVVRGVNFSMHNGEVAGLLGPNGAGKTTIFYMIVGFYRPSAGIVTMDDIDITAKPMYRRARQGIAYLPQEASIFRKLTVEQNIWAILESRRDIKKAAKKERLEGLLDEFGIGRIRRQYGFTLSGGERRRTEIARALATEPKFLLLDEPFAGIDPIAVYEIKQIIRRLAEKGIGILITDHNVRDTLEITTEAFIIADGSIVARGDKEVILADEMVREVYLGSEFKM
jgi:lipopolysaccharide export system ATP-binding protein